MYSYEDRIKAVRLYLKLGKRLGGSVEQVLRKIQGQSSTQARLVEIESCFVKHLDITRCQLREIRKIMNYPKRPLPTSASELSDVTKVTALIAERFRTRSPCLLLRYGDTSGRIIARPNFDTPEYEYLKSFLGTSVTPNEIDFLAEIIERSVASADVIGLRSDLLGRNITDEILQAGDGDIRQRLVDAYPIREFERTRLDPDGARRLAQTRKAMESVNLPESAILTDAWVHVSMAETGFLSALMREAPSFSIVTSTERRSVVQRLVEALPNRVRFFECPCYPWTERQWGGDHSFLWSRWTSIVSSIRPAYPGEPLLISSGIWTKAIAPAWSKQGGIALDIGSVMDYLDKAPTRSAVLATRYGDPKTVPEHLDLNFQLQRSQSLADFL
jgi:hypothetical protein